jgi:hypothetical protein
MSNHLAVMSAKPPMGGRGTAQLDDVGGRGEAEVQRPQVRTLSDWGTVERPSACVALDTVIDRSIADKTGDGRPPHVPSYICFYRVGER